MNPLLGLRAQKSRGLFTRQGAGLGPCPQLWRAHSCPYRVFSPEPRYARPAGANATLSSERGETSWQPPTGWHRGLACRLPGLQSPGCSWWGGGGQGSTPHQHPRPSWGRADGEKTLWAVHYMGFAEMSPLSHPPGPSPSHLSSRGLPPNPCPSAAGPT